MTVDGIVGDFFRAGGAFDHCGGIREEGEDEDEEKGEEES